MSEGTIARQKQKGRSLPGCPPGDEGCLGVSLPRWALSAAGLFTSETHFSIQAWHSRSFRLCFVTDFRPVDSETPPPLQQPPAPPPPPPPPPRGGPTSSAVSPSAAYRSRVPPSTSHKRAAKLETLAVHRRASTARPICMPPAICTSPTPSCTRAAYRGLASCRLRSRSTRTSRFSQANPFHSPGFGPLLCGDPLRLLSLMPILFPAIV